MVCRLWHSPVSTGSHKRQVDSFCCRYVRVSKTSGSSWERGLGVLCAYCCTTCVCMICRAFLSAMQNLFCHSCNTFAVASSSCWNDLIPSHSTAGRFCSICTAVLRNFTSVVQTILCYQWWWCYSVLSLHDFVCGEILWQKFKSNLFFNKKAQQKQMKQEDSIRHYSQETQDR